MGLFKSFNKYNKNTAIIDKEYSNLSYKQVLTETNEIKKEIKSNATMKTLINRFNKEPLSVVQNVVNQSIENNYQGLFWDKAVQEKKKLTKSPTSNLPF